MNKEKQLQLNKENAEEIYKKIIEEADYEIGRIIEKARREADKILKEAKQEAEKTRQNILQGLDKELEKTKERIISSVSMEKRKIALNENNRFIEDILRAAKKIAEEFRHSNGDYFIFLKKAILEGVRVIDENDIEILYSFLDEKIILGDFERNIENLCSKNFNNNFSLRFQKSDFADIGVILRSGDQRIIYDNRFLARLNRAHDDLYMRLLKEAL